MAREYPDISSFSLHKILDRSAKAIEYLKKDEAVLKGLVEKAGFAGAAKKK